MTSRQEELGGLVPELPEVETTRRGVAPWLINNRIVDVVVRCRKLRWPVPRAIGAKLRGQTVRDVARRAKYLLLCMDRGTLLIHLGMTGSLRVSEIGDTPGPYDHFELIMADGVSLRLRDPRRFGSIHWTMAAPEQHALLRHLGPEPLGDAFDGDYLFQMSRRRQVAVKSFLMNGVVVVGVGNIYASEALFRSRIHPRRAAGRISCTRYRDLAGAVRSVLTDAIRAGGTTLQDFRTPDDRAGHFRNQLDVYGRAGAPCVRCAHPLRRIVIGQRSTFYCPHCQH